MSTGYTIAMAQVIDAHHKADKKNPVFKLAKLAVKHQVSMATLADRFGVSRSAVYYWFTGAYAPHPTKLDAINDMIRELEAQQENA